MKTQAIFLTVMTLFTIPAFAKRLPDPKKTSLMCSASYLVRELKQVYAEVSGGVVTNLEVKTVSSIAVDFSRAIGGGGGDVMGDRMKLNKKNKIAYSYPNYLKDPRGLKLQAIGGFSNGYANYKRKKREYEFEVTFYPEDNAADGANVGPEFKILGDGTQIAEIRENEFIQVTCNYVKRFQFPKESE